MIRARGGADVLFGRRKADELNGGPGGDGRVINGHGAGLHGNAGSDILRGGRGPDFLYGGNGTDKLRGQRGGDMIVADDDGFTKDRVWGGGSNDYCYLGYAIDTHEGGCEYIVFSHWA